MKSRWGKGFMYSVQRKRGSGKKGEATGIVLKEEGHWGLLSNSLVIQRSRGKERGSNQLICSPA